MNFDLDLALAFVMRELRSGFTTGVSAGGACDDEDDDVLLDDPGASLAHDELLDDPGASLALA